MEVGGVFKQEDANTECSINTEAPCKHEANLETEHSMVEALDVPLDQVLEVKLEEEPAQLVYEDNTVPVKQETDDDPIYNVFTGHSMFQAFGTKQESQDARWEGPLKEDDDDSSHFVSLADLRNEKHVVKTRYKRARNTGSDSTEKSLNFACDLCDYRCNNNTKLTIHKRRHTGEKPFGCKLCEYKCTNNSRLMMHMMTHTGEKPFSCKLCDYKCTANYYLVRHMRVHSGEKPYSCKLCEYKCTQHCNLVRHMTTHTSEKTFVCKTCNVQFADKPLFVYHMRSHCDNIDALEETCKSLETALNQKEPLSKLMSGANFKTIQFQGFKKIVYLSNSETMPQDKSATQSKGLSEQIRFICDVCHKIFKHKKSLIAHSRLHLPEDSSSSTSRDTGKKKFVCVLCNFICTQNSMLLMHIRSHANKNILACNLCDFMCTQYTMLAMHKSTHVGEKQFTCNVCDYKCREKTKLDCHSRTHEKPFTCDLCSCKFKLKSSLQTHIKNHKSTHAGGKFYVCELCGWKSKTRSSLGRHMSIHNGEPIVCKICNYKFTSRSTFLRHTKTHLGDMS